MQIYIYGVAIAAACLIIGIVIGSGLSLRSSMRVVEASNAEVNKWRAAATYILSQTGDDLCWRDFYEKLAGCFPAEHPLAQAAGWKALPEASVFLRNCQRFCESLGTGGTYKVFEDKPLPMGVRAIAVTVQYAIRSLHMVDYPCIATHEVPAAGLTTAAAQPLVHQALDKCLERLQK